MWKSDRARYGGSIYRKSSVDRRCVMWRRVACVRGLCIFAGIRDGKYGSRMRAGSL